MADDTASATDDDAKTDETTDDAVVDQAEKPDAVKNALAAERARAKAAEQKANELAAKVEEFENANKSELEKLANKATKAEQAKAEAESKLLRFEVANEKKVPADAVGFLTGTTREELEAQADQLLELVKKPDNTDTQPDFDGGPREPAGETDPAKAHNEFVAQLFAGRRPT